MGKSQDRKCRTEFNLFGDWRALPGALWLNNPAFRRRNRLILEMARLGVKGLGVTVYAGKKSKED